MDPQSDLLFGVFAVQLGLVTPRQVMACAAAWAADRSRSIAERLEADQGLTAEQRRMLDDMVDAAVGAHNGDVNKALESMGGDSLVRASFGASVVVGDDGEVSTAEPETGEAAGAAQLATETRGKYSFPDGDAEIGRGGIGRVLIAVDNHLGREIAVKELLGRDGADEERAAHHTTDRVTRFLREAQVTGQLEHPSIVPVYEVGRRASGELYYTMKLVRGRTLSSALHSVSTWRERLDLLRHFVDVCQAVAYAHSRGVIHRDIKAENIMIGEFGETVLLDWGLAKVHGKQDLRSGAIAESVRLLKGAKSGDTLQGQAIGTPAYMSPEQADGDVAAVDERSDVWSLGVVLYELLTGDTPFAGGSPLAVITKVIRCPVQPVRELCPDVPPELAAICEKALRRDKQGRYRGARELASEVNAFLTGGRVAAHAYSSWELWRRFAARQRNALRVAGAAVLLLLLLATGAYVRVTGERNRAVAAEAEERRRRAEAQQESANGALAAGDLLEARAKLRGALEAGDSATARALWQRAQREPLEWRRAFPDPLYAVAFSPVGDRIAAAGHGGSIYLLDPTDGRARVRRGHLDQVRSLAYSRDGRTLVSGSADNSIRVWEEEASGAPLLVLEGHQATVRSVAISPDQRLLASASDDFTVRLWDLTTGEERALLRDHSETVYAVAFNPSGTTLASGGRDRTVRLWDLVASPPTSRVLADDADTVTSLAFSPDNEWVAGASGRTVTLWRAQNGEAKTLLRGEAIMMSVAYSPDGALVAGADRLGRVQLVHVASGRESLLRDNDAMVWGITFGPAGDRLVSASVDHSVRLWRLEPRAMIPTRRGHGEPASKARFLPGGARLISAGQEGSIRIWDRITGEQERVFGSDMVWSLSPSPEGRWLATGGMDNRVRLWDLASGTVGLSFEADRERVMTSEISPDGKLVASASLRGVLRLWDARSGELRAELVGHRRGIMDVTFSPDGRLLASAGDDATARIWQVPSGRELRVLKGHTDRVRAVAFGPDGTRLATAAWDQTVRTWEVASGRGDILGRDAGRLHAVSFSPDGTQIATASSDHDARIWKVETGDYRVLRGHRSEVNDIHFSADGELLATASDDGTVRTWRVSDGRPHWRATVMVGTTPGPPHLLTHGGWVMPGDPGQAHPPTASAWRSAVEKASRGVATADGRWLCTVDEAEEVALWDLEKDARIAGHRIAGVEQVETLPGGCAALGRGSVSLFSGGGPLREVAGSASALVWDDDALLVAGDRVVTFFDGYGRAFGDPLEADVGVCALRRAAGGLVLGFADGSVEVRRGAGIIALEEVPASAPARILSGPMGTTIIGFTNGLIGLWDLETGERLDHGRLHGAVRDLQISGDRLYAASDLGDSLVWDLRPFHDDYCTLMREVWLDAPLAWDHGRAVRREPPAGHRCATSRR